MSHLLIMNSYEQAIQTPCEDADESVQEAKRILGVVIKRTNHNVKVFMRAFDWIEQSKRQE